MKIKSNIKIYKNGVPKRTAGPPPPIKNMEIKKTHRGFNYSEFTDDNGVRCSLQKSSSAMEDKIWLGVMDTDPRIMCTDARKLGLLTIGNVGWQPFMVPDEVLFNDRMHLTRKQVKKLLPHLEKFVKTGEL